MGNDYWLSFSSYEGPGYTYHCDGFMISVVLDSGTRNNFSKIRLILAYEESEIFNNLVCCILEVIDYVPPHQILSVSVIVCRQRDTGFERHLGSHYPIGG